MWQTNRPDILDLEQLQRDLARYARHVPPGVSKWAALHRAFDALKVDDEDDNLEVTCPSERFVSVRSQASNYTLGKTWRLAARRTSYEENASRITLQFRKWALSEREKVAVLSRQRRMALFSAAPDLLTACEMALAALTRINDNEKIGATMYLELGGGCILPTVAIQRLRDAIALARGEPSLYECDCETCTSAPQEFPVIPGNNY